MKPDEPDDLGELYAELDRAQKIREEAHAQNDPRPRMPAMFLAPQPPKVPDEKRKLYENAISLVVALQKKLNEEIDGKADPTAIASLAIALDHATSSAIRLEPRGFSEMFPSGFMPQGM